MTFLLPPTPHPMMWVVVLGAALGYAAMTDRRHYPAQVRQRVRFAAAMLLVVIAWGWPLGDLAQHVSLSALVVQRLILLLAVAPLLVTSLPDDLVAAMSRPRIVDRVVVLVGHPGLAIATVFVVGTTTLLPAVVSWGSANIVQAAIVSAATLVLGIVLWLPILGAAPATRRLSLVAKGGYLIAASLVVTSLSFVWIFASHPLYPSFSGQSAILGISPLFDQQLAGFISKFGAYVPMWAAAFVLFARSGDAQTEEPVLRWVDVERELERADRRAAVVANARR